MFQTYRLAFATTVHLGVGLAWAFNGSSLGRSSRSVEREGKRAFTSSSRVDKFEQTNSPVIHVTASSFGEHVLKSNVRVPVDFYAHWCGPCQHLAPILDEFAREMDEVTIVKVNVDDNAELVKTYHVGSIPTLLVFDNGQVVSRYVGVANKDGLKALLTD